MTERRRAERHPVFLEVREINGQPGLDSHVVDLSDHGGKLETHIAFFPGDAVSFTVVLPEEERETRWYGTVIWRLPSPTHAGRYLLGLTLFPYLK